MGIAGEIRSVRAADGARIEYEVQGEGPPLAMLHGLLASRYVFSRQRAELAARHRLIFFSSRGHDGSEPIVPANYGVGTSDVDDLRAVLDAEQVDRVSLFAHSSGGATGFVFASQMPDRVARAVLIEPTLLSLLPPADLAEIKPAYETIVAVAAADGPDAGLQTALEFLSGGAWGRLDAEARTRRLAAMASSAAIVGPHVQGLLDLNVTEEDVLRLRPPTLLLYGADSFPFEAVIARRIRALRPDLPVLTVENSGHNVHRDRPDIVNAEVLAFLAT